MMMRSLLRRLDRFRRDHTQALSHWFYRQIGKDKHLIDARLPKQDVKTILVLRNNKRIGNMYFMLPFLHALRAAYPNAKIDLMLIAASQASIFHNLGLNQIIISRFSFKTGWAFLRTLRQTRQTIYDLVIMPHASASDTIIGGMLHGRNKVAFRTARTAAVYPHAYEVTPKQSHAAYTALALIEALGHRLDAQPDHTMVFDEDELTLGQQTVAELRGSAKYCVAFFRGARGNKVIADTQWHLVIDQLNEALPQDITWVEVLSPDVREPLINGCLTFESPDLRRLASVLRACDLFLCGDTGPLHLADAALARCVGLFTATDTKHYGCLSHHCLDVTLIEQLPLQAIKATLLDSLRQRGTA